MATSSSTDPARGLRPRRPALIAAAVALAFAVAAVGAVLAPRPGADDATATPRFRAADRSFSVALPAGWRADTARTLRTVPSAPAAVLRRADRRGLVVIRRRPALRRSGRPLARDLTAQLGRRFRGLRPVGARTVRLASGPAYVYTFARASAGTVQSVAIAPQPDRTYTLDAVAPVGAADAAAQIGAIVRSFDTSDPAPRS